LALPQAAVSTHQNTHQPNFTPNKQSNQTNSFLCRAEGEHNDLATLFLSSGHDTIVRLFSVGAVPGQPFVRHFTPVRYVACPGLCVRFL
jgi:hypothetical protein